MIIFVHKTDTMFPEAGESGLGGEVGRLSPRRKGLGVSVPVAEASSIVFLSACPRSTRRGRSTSLRFCGTPSSSSATTTLTTWATSWPSETS